MRWTEEVEPVPEFSRTDKSRSVRSKEFFVGPRSVSVQHFTKPSRAARLGSARPGPAHLCLFLVQQHLVNNKTTGHQSHSLSPNRILIAISDPMTTWNFF